MDNYNFAIIGCGRISSKHVEGILTNHGKIQLVAASDIVYEKAEKLKRIYFEQTCNTINTYEDYKEMLTHEDINTVLIATPSGSHFEIAAYCMNQKKNTIIEKPMAINDNQAEELTAKSKNMGILLSVCHQNRFNPSIQALKKAITQKRFGRIFSGSVKILWNRNKAYYDEAEWRGTFAYDGGCLMNQCIHAIDILLWLMDSDIERINAITENYFHNYIEAEDYGNIQLLFKNGSVGSIEGTVNTYDKNLFEQIIILGENGTVIIGGQAMNIVEVWKFKDDLDTLEEVQAKCNENIDNIYGFGHGALFRNFIETLEGTSSLMIDGKEASKSVKLISSVYKMNR